MPSLPDLEPILNQRDRSFTLALIAELTTCAEAERRADLAHTLSLLEDPRAVAPLQTLLHDRSADSDVRQCAAQILHDSAIAPDLSDQALRALWTQGDATEQCYALMNMTPVQRDILVEVAQDPDHPHYPMLLAHLGLGFSHPDYIYPLIDALGHPDAELRAAAAFTLLWTEPNAACDPLLRAAAGSDPDLVTCAVNTLRYYPTQAVLRQIHGLIEHQDANVRQEADSAFSELRDRFQWAASHRNVAVRSRLRTWMAPVWALLALTEADLEPEEYTPSSYQPTLEVLSADDFIAQYSASDAPWGKRSSRLHRIDPSAFSLADRERLTAFFVASDEVCVREFAGKALAAWGEVEALVTLTQDPVFRVRKSAVYALGTLPPNPLLADVAWQALSRSWSTHGNETLATFAQHAPPERSTPILLQIARDRHAVEEFRRAAIDILLDHKRDEALTSLLPLLEQPPVLTWSLHLALLHALEQRELTPPDLSWLHSVDHVDVQVALAKL